MRNHVMMIPIDLLTNNRSATTLQNLSAYDQDPEESPLPLSNNQIGRDFIFVIHRQNLELT